MQNPALERRLKDCQELSEAWKLYLELYNVAIKGEQITPDAEARFLTVKSRIAMVHDSFIESLKHDQAIGQNVFGIITRSITLRHLNRMNSPEAKKIEIEWHECYLLLTETITSLEEEIQKLGQVNALTFHLGRFLANFGHNMKLFFTSFYFKIFAAIAAVVFVIVGIPALGIYDYENLRKNEKFSGVYGKWLDLKRATIDSSAPFASIDSFYNRYFPSSIPPEGCAYDTKATASDQPKASKRFDSVTLDGKSMGELLRSALAYRSIFITRIGAGIGTLTEIQVFYYYSNKEAFEIANGYRNFTANMKDAPPVFAVNNVVVIMVGQDNDTKNIVLQKHFAQTGK